MVEYLGSVVEDMIRTRTQHLVPCGGPTFQRSFPGMTEARRIADYVAVRVPFPLTIELEEDSFTTFDNIKGAATIIRDLHPLDIEWRGDSPRVDEITIWCEATRALKVDMLARHFMPRPEGHPRVRIKTSSWELASPLKEIVGTLKEWAATKAPIINRIHRAQRMAAAKLR